MHLLANDISFGYSKEQQVLKNVSISLKPGVLTGILGPNGSGKSTLLKLVTGEIKPDSGSITLDGEPISSFGARALALKMALVPQRSHVTFDFTALDVVLMGRHPHLKRFQSERPEDIQKARGAMERLGVLHLAERRISMLSGGEWQRVTIARALCQEAGILLLDEPVSSLDIRHQIEALRLVRDLAHTDSVACACVLHDISLAAHFCDELCALHDGRVYSYGAPDKVVTPEMLRDVYGIAAGVGLDASGRPRVEPDYD